MPLHITSTPTHDITLPAQFLKEHPERQISQIAASIEAFGFNDPVAMDETGEIIEGVGRVLAARRLGLSEIPVILLGHLNAAQKKAYRIAHNKICQNSGFNLDLLRIEFEALSQLDASLLETTGFEEAELSELLTLAPLPELSPELSETLQNAKKVTCPHCGGVVHV